jgi:hypothetical protein
VALEHTGGNAEGPTPYFSSRSYYILLGVPLMGHFSTCCMDHDPAFEFQKTISMVWRKIFLLFRVMASGEFISAKRASSS